MKSTSYSVSIRNKRSYTLEGVSVFNGSSLVGGPLTLEPQAQAELVVSRTAADVPQQRLTAKYTTHRGLAMISQLDFVVPVQTSMPVMLNVDSLDLTVTPEQGRGRLLGSAELKFVVPAAWQAAQVNGQTFSVSNGMVTAPLAAPMRPVVALERSADGTNWVPTTSKEIGVGAQRVRFKLPPNTPDDAILLLAGLGTKQFHYRYGNGEWIKASSHNYRENLLTAGLVRAGAPEGEYINLLLARTVTEFISSTKHPTCKQIDIDFETPRVFSPPRFEITRG